MTDEMEKKSKRQFVILRGPKSWSPGEEVKLTYVDCADAEGEAVSKAKELAGNDPDSEYRCYQFIGAAELKPEVVWRGRD